MPDLLVQLQTALADRYRVDREIGRGGMAYVFLAHDLKLDRPVALKVLRPDLAPALGAERFLREIEVAAKLAHPHILPIHDSGRAAAQQGGGEVGFLYFVMPYVEGESLRDRLDREHQLPLDDALQIAREVADALSHAHVHGVIHRDIKPENILLVGGHAVVADFGIAKAVSAAGGRALTETGLAIGTPAYMSPEQSTGEESVDGRSDLYSLGCVLYEMLAGEPPFTGSTAQAVFAKRLSDPVPRVSVLRDSVPAPVEAALTKALARSPADRFLTAQQLVDALTPPWPSGALPVAAARRPLPRGLVAIVALAVTIGLGVTVGVSLLSSSGIDFAARDWIVVTEFENQTGDSVFEGSLLSALMVGLQQSRYVNVLPRARVAVLLAQMERPDTTRLDETTGREVALRANAQALVVPTIARIDSTYLMSTRIVDPESGEDLLSRSGRAEGRGQVLGALDDLLRQLRRDLGESRWAVSQDGVRLDHATTASLEALRAWTEGNRLWNTRRLHDAAERYRRALDLDSNFAMARKALGDYHAWYNRPDSSQYHFTQALAQLDRVTERERLLIESSAAGSRQDWAAALRAQETYVERYPDDLRQRYNLGSSYMRADRDEDAIRVLSEVVALDSTHVAAFINLATSYNRMGAVGEALPQYQRAFALRPDRRLVDNLNHEYGFTLVKAGQVDSAEATFRAMLSETPDQQAQGHRSLALLRMYQGRFAEARAHLDQAIVRNRATSATLSEFRNRLYLATNHLRTDNRPALRTQLRHAQAIADTTFVGPAWLARLVPFYLVLDDTLAAGHVLDLMRERSADAGAFDRAATQVAEAHLMLARGNHADAIALLQGAILVSRTLAAEIRPVLASAYLRAGDRELAMATYLELIAEKPLGWEPQDRWILAHADVASLYAEQGDTVRAVEFYRRLVDLWKDGDEDLVARTDARERLAALLRGP